ncbi:MAG TPA: Hsp20/alpha crystallin family protein [Spirochaetia bacterium]|nr:Hsp20/alpha crystallin family protein [Spirochaetia bacterium]
MAMNELETERRSIRPIGTIYEEDEVVRLRLEMPGVAKEDLSVHVEADQLLVEGVRKSADEAGEYLLRERPDRDYRQSYTLDETIDRTKIGAELANGVLTVTLHLKDEVKPRRIEVNAE